MNISYLLSSESLRPVDQYLFNEMGREEPEINVSINLDFLWTMSTTTR